MARLLKIKLLPADATRQTLQEAQTKIAEEVTTKLNQQSFGTDIFEAADQSIQDAFLSGFELNSLPRQADAITWALTHHFPIGKFHQAESDATQRLNSMTIANQAAKDAAIYADALREEFENSLFRRSTLYILAPIVVAILLLGGPVAVFSALAGIAGFFLIWGELVANATGGVEAAGAAVYVDGIIPYVYLNHSVDDAFGPQVITSSKSVVAGAIKSDIQSILSANDGAFAQSQSLQDYYLRLRARIKVGDSTWTTVGIDSLNYYENLAQLEENRTIAEFIAASDSARQVINGYDAMVNRYILQTAARQMLSTSVKMGALVYRAGYTDTTVVANALAAVDSTTNQGGKTNTLRSTVYNSLQVQVIPIPTAVGIEGALRVFYRGVFPMIWVYYVIFTSSQSPLYAVH